MSGSERLETVPIEPAYAQASPSEPIEFGTVLVQLTHQANTYIATANVQLRFAPNVRLLFIISDDGVVPGAGNALLDEERWDHKFFLPDRGVSIDVFLTAAGPGRGFIFTPTKSVVALTPRSPEMTAAIFHLFNLPDFRGPDNYVIATGQPPAQGWKSCGRFILNSEGWRFNVAAIDQTKDFVTALKEQGGHVITHMGQVEREDHSPFSSNELDGQLLSFMYFLSFALGRWCGPALPIGFNAAGERVFEEWGVPRVAEGPWHSDGSWFDLHHAELLSQVFPGFMHLWRDELWNGPLRKAIYLYLGASEPGRGINVDTGLILSQAALELLAWNYCVRHRKMVSPKAFDRRGLSAADKLRILASSLDIPLQIPDALTDLHARPGRKWDDAMDAITGLRNSVVHPGPERSVKDDSFFEAWKLSMWYIDMVLLRLCGHSGSYANRLSARYVGQVEFVPWAGQAPAT